MNDESKFENENEEINISSVENFINEKFYQTLITRINDEVKKSVKVEFERYVNDNKLKVVKHHEESPNEQTHCNKLLDEIELLRAELRCVIKR